MRSFLFLLLLVLGGLPVLAQNMLNVQSKSGTVVSFAFSEKPVVTYNDEILVLKTENTSVEYPLSDLEKLTFSNSESAVESIFVTGITGDSSIRIFDTFGRIVKTIKATENADSTPLLILNDLEDGIYIIKQGSVSYKITKQ